MEQSWRPTPLHSPMVSCLPEVEPPLVPNEEEEQEEKLEEKTPPTLHFSSSSPDEAIVPPPPIAADEFRYFEELFFRIADSLGGN